MLNSLIRKIYFKGMTNEQIFSFELAIDSFKMDYFSYYILWLVIFSPYVSALATLLTAIFYGNMSLYNIIVGTLSIVLPTILLIWFLIKFKDELENFRNGIARKLYSRFLTKGNALSIADFDTLKRENEIIYKGITSFKVSGLCYHTSFELLKTLKKGKILFTAIKWVNTVENITHTYTMHALYTNNDWCYDTFSLKQHPLEFALTHFCAKEYKTFSYEDIKDKSYDEFRKETADALKIWCKENDCHENWSNFDLE